MEARLKKMLPAFPSVTTGTDCTQQNSLEAESMAGQGLTTGRSARGWMDQSAQINTNFTTNGNTP